MCVMRFSFPQIESGRRRAGRGLALFAPLALFTIACADTSAPPPLGPPTVSEPLASAIPPPKSLDPSEAGIAVSVDAGPTSSPQEAIHAAVNAPDRDDKDKALDPGRHPAEMLSFFGIAPGMKVGELVAGAGYTTELLARTVGGAGSVWAENPPFILDKFAAIPWTARLGKPVMANVRRLDRELDAPFAPETHELDAVLIVLFYHDTVWLKTDRAKMNKAVFDALKSGGVYGVVDHSARAGAGTTVAQSLHRIEEKTVVDEVTKAGFKLAGEADFLRNPKDARDWNDSPTAAAGKRGTSDRFVLKFVKP
jgi:predicted methyltransferase